MTLLLMDCGEAIARLADGRNEKNVAPKNSLTFVLFSCRGFVTFRVVVSTVSVATFYFNK